MSLTSFMACKANTTAGIFESAVGFLILTVNLLTWTLSFKIGRSISLHMLGRNWLCTMLLVDMALQEGSRSMPFLAMVPFKTSTGTSPRRKPCVKWHWTRKEDDLLCLLVQIHGPGKWDRIASHIHGRTGKSCRIRWINQLNPRVNKMPFSAEEKQRLLELHREYGNRWSAIVSYFPGRTDNQVKNQYHILAGTRYMKALGSSASTDPHASLKKGSRGLSPYQSISTIPVGSQFSDGANLTSIYPHERISHGNSMMSDDSSGAFAKLCPVPQPQQGVGIKDYQFIDFLGVGSSE